MEKPIFINIHSFIDSNKTIIMLINFSETIKKNSLNIINSRWPYYQNIKKTKKKLSAIGKLSDII